MRQTRIQDVTGECFAWKAIELMNLKLHTDISDITGLTGRSIVEVIIAGERGYKFPSAGPQSYQSEAGSHSKVAPRPMER
ncbi:MAG: hypothetical protein BGO21_02230 [Dyadobacter sp. 50-39]|nr:MAG: hypothetical protein BGO21_02230 [Dyadobacter sp. 50-39]